MTGFIIRLIICVHLCGAAGFYIGHDIGYTQGYDIGQKEVNAYKTELELSKKEADRAIEMYTELLATCRGEQ